jgi:hypothetical protein
MLNKSNIAAIILLSAALSGCNRGPESAASSADTSFAALQSRGAMAMGVDQYTSSHEFDITADGGRVSLQRDSADSVGIAEIRAHMRLIQRSFEAGDFSTPAFVHDRDMPGTAVMAKKREAITYTYLDLPRGAAVAITTRDSAARVAIADFMNAQRGDHHSGGSDHALRKSN